MHRFGLEYGTKKRANIIKGFSTEELEAEISRRKEELEKSRIHDLLRKSILSVEDGRARISEVERNFDERGESITFTFESI